MRGENQNSKHWGFFFSEKATIRRAGARLSLETWEDTVGEIRSSRQCNRRSRPQGLPRQGSGNRFLRWNGFGIGCRTS